MIRRDHVGIADLEHPEQRKRDLQFFRRIYIGNIKLDKRQMKVMMPDCTLRSLGYDMEEFAQELAEQGLFGEVE